MATLAQINDTLKDQTSSIEDGTKTTEGLKDRFGKFLDRQQGSGDKRENEIEARQKERRQRVMASRPTSFTQGVTQGLGFGGGLGFGAIAQKLLAGMGIAAGAIGLGAGKLLRFGPAILALSDFGEKAIRGMVDYIDEEIEGVDFKEETKKRLTQGGQAAIAAKLLGAKGLFGPAIAGVIGAYGDTAIEKFNSFFGKKDGKYNIPLTDIEIDTQTDSFKTGMAAALGLAAGPLLRLTGGVLAAAIAMLPATRFTKLVLGTVTAMFGLKGAVGTALKNSVNKRYDAKQMMKINNPIPNPPKALGGSAAANLLGSGRPVGKPVTIKPAFPKNPGYVGRGPDGKFMSFNDPLGESKLPKTGLSSFLQSFKKFDSALRVTSKILLPVGIAAEVAFAQNNPNFDGMDPYSKGAGGVITSPLALVDSLQHLFVTGQNLTKQAMNFGFDKAGIDYQYDMSDFRLDTAGPAQRAINVAYGNYLQNPTSAMIAASKPNIGLQPGAGAGFVDAPGVFVGGSTNTMTDNSIQIIGIGTTVDLGSQVVNMPD